MQGKTLLLVNSSQVLMDLTEKILRRSGFSVYCAIGVAGAREYLMDFTPDAIILDNDLPDGNGMDYCRDLRKESSVPIMMLSNSKEDELLAFQAGANDFIKKPYDNNIMIARLDIILNESISISQEVDMDISSVNGLGAATQETAAITADKSNSIIRRVFMGAAACLVFAFVGLGIYNIMLDQPDHTDLADGPVALSDIPPDVDDTAKPYIGEEPSIIFPGIESVTVKTDMRNADMLLRNPESNTCYLTFEIILKDSGESLYKSGMVNPGMCIEEITLNSGLPKGEYKAVMKIHAYAPESLKELNGADAEFIITVN